MVGFAKPMTGLLSARQRAGRREQGRVQHHRSTTSVARRDGETASHSTQHSEARTAPHSTEHRDSQPASLAQRERPTFPSPAAAVQRARPGHLTPTLCCILLAPAGRRRGSRVDIPLLLHCHLLVPHVCHLTAGFVSRPSASSLLPSLHSHLSS